MPEALEIIDVRQAAEFLRLHPKRLYDLAGRGDVPSFRLGNRIFFSLAKLRDFVESGGTPRKPRPDAGVESVA